MFKMIIGGMAPIDNRKLPAAILAGGFAASAGMSTMTIPMGSSVGVANPGTIFSAPPVVIIEPPSLVSATKQLKSDIEGANVTKGLSMIPVYLRDAFLSLTFLVTGINSMTPTPTPLVLAGARTM